MNKHTRDQKTQNTRPEKDATCPFPQVHPGGGLLRHAPVALMLNIRVKPARGETVEESVVLGDVVLGIAAQCGFA